METYVHSLLYLADSC